MGQCTKLRMVDCYADYLYAASQGNDYGDGTDYFHNGEHLLNNTMLGDSTEDELGHFNSPGLRYIV